MRTTDYIDALRVRLDAATDYQLSKRLGIAPNVLARYRKGGTFDNTMAARVAELLDRNPLEVIGDMELERARTDAQREQWAKVLQRIQRAAAVVVGAACIGPLALPPAPASADELYIMLNCFDCLSRVC